MIRRRPAQTWCRGCGSPPVSLAASVAWNATRPRARSGRSPATRRRLTLSWHARPMPIPSALAVTPLASAACPVTAGSLALSRWFMSAARAATAPAASTCGGEKATRRLISPTVRSGPETVRLAITANSVARSTGMNSGHPSNTAKSPHKPLRPRLPNEMKHLLSTLFLLFTFASCALAELPAGWATNFTAALAQAKAQQQPVLAYFTASWCGPCKLMARTTLTNEAVTQTLNGFSHVVVDIDEHHDLAEKHGARAVPTFQILTAAGDEVSTTTGYQDAGRFLQWLTNGVSEAKEADARQKQLVEKLASADQLLRKTDAESLGKAALELFDLCAERNEAMS